ncbi:4-hydroxythreonine-4-phosphate dehydrogenase 2 [Mannheimia haemolytica]|uniref:4-hydroxythreonine-4-phosphate dehydrogenase 2 n=1 Tax=Mannheimia haemolytica TaxID=75985 RepID=A0A378MV35_MANHA|nr:4-hydroxythreonine-4-phosphate dehydrogenase 2 [Mannheimia haemolytica]
MECFGDEDQKEIVPAIQEAQAKGFNVTGPVPPDTLFHRAANLNEFDIVVCDVSRSRAYPYQIY